MSPKKWEMLHKGSEREERRILHELGGGKSEEGTEQSKSFRKRKKGCPGAGEGTAAGEHRFNPVGREGL